MTGRATLGVVLMTYGSPADLDDMPRYLAAVRGGRPAAEELVAEFRRRYELIGGSPLIPITQAQAAAVEARLADLQVDARVRAAMRFSEPAIRTVIASLAAEGCDTIVGIIMSPQFSGILMSGYERALREAVEAIGPSAPAFRLAPAWFGDDQFIEAIARRINEGLARLPAAGRDRAPVLLTAHSLPLRVAESEPEYLAQLYQTAEAVATRAALDRDRWHFCWQSAGHEPGAWMKPDFADLLPTLRAAGDRSVLVAPVQFLADHLEVLYDIDIAARQQAEAAGMAFARIESLNVLPSFIACLARTALRTADDGARVSQAARYWTTTRFSVERAKPVAGYAGEDRRGEG
jgi:protoporphyrin/coproporphyrin ferrochelatase